MHSYKFHRALVKCKVTFCKEATKQKVIEKEAVFVTKPYLARSHELSHSFLLGASKIC